VEDLPAPFFQNREILQNPLTPFISPDISQNMRQNSDGQNALPVILSDMLLGTHLYENGADLMTIKTLLGHKSLESTTIYVHLAVNGKHTATARTVRLSKKNSGWINAEPKSLTRRIFMWSLHFHTN
jgi:hypothetical protein